MAYPLGTSVTIQVEFQDENDTLKDPTTVTLYVKQPKQNQAITYTDGDLTRVSTGIYTYNILLTVPGTWTYCWVGTGALEAATFDVPIVVTKSPVRS